MSEIATTSGSPTDAAPSNDPTQPDWGAAQKLAVICAIAGFATLIGIGLLNLGAVDSYSANGQIFTSLLVGFIYWFSLPFGGLCLLFFHYLAKTSWGVLLKRLIEAATRTFPLFVILWLVIGVSLTVTGPATYWWVNPSEANLVITSEMKEAAEKVKQYESAPSGVANRPSAEEYFLALKIRNIEHELQERNEGNLGFLTVPMFFVVGAIGFATWSLLSYFLNRWSRDMDDPNQVLVSLEKCSNLSGPGIILWAITGTAIATQWVMSLEPSWASTMFPVIFGINAWLTCFAFCLALFLTLAAKPPLKSLLRDKFQIDMGTLMLVFTLLWSYTGFSQMMLIWVGNLPEEIPFYLKRSNPRYGFWWCVSAGLIALHFALPFLLLLFRDIKLHPQRLRAVAIYLLVICAIDVIWWIEPAIEGHDGPGLYLLMDLGAILGVGGLFGLYFIHHAKQRPLIAFNETYWLPEGHDHHEQH